MKKLIAVTLISLLGVFALAAQGTVEGRYDQVSMIKFEDGEEVDYWDFFKEMFELTEEPFPESYIEFLKDGKFTLVFLGESEKGTFKQNGNTITIILDNTESTLTIEGNRITFVHKDEGKFVYEKRK